jgi:hypothetical protein
LVKEIEFLERYAIIHSMPKGQVERLEIAKLALEHSARVCIEFAFRELSDCLDEEPFTSTKLQFWLQDFQERESLMDKLILRVFDIIYPISKQLDALLLLWTEKLVDLAIKAQKRWDTIIDRFVFHSTSHALESPVQFALLSIKEVVQAFGGYFLTQAIELLLQKIHNLALQGSLDVLVAALVLKTLLPFQSSTKGIYS